MKKIKTIIAALIALFGLAAVFSSAQEACAEGAIKGFLVSPMRQQLILAPGETTKVTLSVSNPNDSKEAISYQAHLAGYVPSADSAESSFSDHEYSTYTEIANWTTITNASGTVSPNDENTLVLTISVPEDAPAGGQYLAVNVMEDPNASDSSDDGSDVGINIQETYVVSAQIFVTVTGDTKNTGTISNLSLPTILFKGNLSGSATVTNTGNVHSDATYTLQVFPLFSDEEVYTNEESPASAIILPSQTYTRSVTWKSTPKFGLYRVRFTVAFADQESVTEKLVLVCPMWFLLIILFVIVLLILWLVSSKKEKSTAKKSKK